MNKHVKALIYAGFNLYNDHYQTAHVMYVLEYVIQYLHDDNGLFSSSLTENLSLEKSQIQYDPKQTRGEIFDFEKEASQLLQPSGQTSESIEVTSTPTSQATLEQPLQAVNAIKNDPNFAKTAKNSTYDSANVINLRIDEYLQYKNDKGKIPEGRD